MAKCNQLTSLFFKGLKTENINNNRVYCVEWRDDKDWQKCHTPAPCTNNNLHILCNTCTRSEACRDRLQLVFFASSKLTAKPGPVTPYGQDRSPYLDHDGACSAVPDVKVTGRSRSGSTTAWYGVTTSLRARVWCAQKMMINISALQPHRRGGRLW